MKKPVSFTQVCPNFRSILGLLISFVPDIQPKNILLGVLDDSAFARFEKDEREYPMPRKELLSRTVYMSRPMPLTKGAPLLCDLSEARFGDAQNTDLVMPDVYRAPEVLLDMPWSYPVDIWSFAMTVRILTSHWASVPKIRFSTCVANSEKAVGSL